MKFYLDGEIVYKRSNNTLSISIFFFSPLSDHLSPHYSDNTLFSRAPLSPHHLDNMFSNPNPFLACL